MTTVAEDPDLFNGLEITEMNEINMENGDEYVLIPSDNENDDENAAGGNDSAEEQPSVADCMAVHIDTDTAASSGMLTGVELDTTLDREVHDPDKMMNLAQEGDDSQTRSNEMFSVNYDFNLDTQDLFNVRQTDAEFDPVTIKEEIEIEEAVVNFPEDDDSVGAQMELFHEDEHNVGSEIVTSQASCDSDEDCVLLSLIEQCPGPIKEEWQDDEKSPHENDHAYTCSQPEDEPARIGAGEQDISVESFMNFSKRLLEDTSFIGTDKANILSNIANIEEQVRALKQKLLSESPESDVRQESILDPELPEQPNILSDSMNNLSLELSGNCSDKLECQRDDDEENSEQSNIKDNTPETPLESLPLETPAVQSTSVPEPAAELESLSVVLSENCSEKLECSAEDVNMSEDEETPSDEPLAEDSTAAMSAVEDSTTAMSAVEEQHQEESLAHEEEEQTGIESSEKLSNVVNCIEDLVSYKDTFFQECDIWLFKAKHNEEEPTVDDERKKLFLHSLNQNVQRLWRKIFPPVDASIQTEKVKVSAQKLNEKYKKRLLSSLEAVYSDDSTESDKDGSSPSTADENQDSDSDDEAFEKRQHRRKSKRLKLKLAEQSIVEDAEVNNAMTDDEDDELISTKKRNIRRLDSTDSKNDDENEEKNEFSEPDLSEFLIPKSPVSSIATASEVCVAASEPHSETDAESVIVSQKPIIRTDSVDYDNEASSITPPSEQQPMEVNEEDSMLVKREPSLDLSQGIVDESKASQGEVESEETSKDTTEVDDADAGAEMQSDSESLDDVLPQVDDILLDVNDILPAAEGVVQEYLVEEEVRTEQDAETETAVPAKPAPLKKPKGVGKKIDSEKEDAEEDSEPESKKQGPAVEDMTESELEEYYDNLREKEIDKLCNLTNLEVARNAYPQKPQEVKKKPVVLKKRDRVMDDILNEAELHHHDSEESESDTEVLQTEELFLQKCNENMKNQLLNQLSSSDTEQESGTDDSVVDALRQEREYDSDDSAGSILMEKFLKSLHKEHEESAGEESKIEEPKEKDEENIDATMLASTDADADKSKESEKDFIDDSGAASVVDDNEEAIEKMKDRLKKSEKASDEKENTGVINTVEKSKKEPGPSHSKTTAIDPIDKQLFSKKMFREVDETLRKDREREALGKENGSMTDRSERIHSEDSDVELLDVSMFKPKRKMKEKTLEDFDFSSTTKRATPQMKRKDAKDDDCISLSSESEAEIEETTADVDEKENKQRKIRTMLTQDQLADETKTAQKDEEVRISRLKRKNENLKKFLTTFKPASDESKLVLDWDGKTGQAIAVHPEIEKLLKPHQREGIRFMYDNSYGSVDYINKHPGSGCILAHCMGLGKTLQLITLLHTVMRYPQLKTRRVLVICPKSTVMNWSDEIQHWLGSLRCGPRLKVFYFPDNSDVNDKLKVLSDWYASNSNRCGCMLIGYEAFRILVNYEKRKRTPSNILAAKAAFVKKKVDEYLLNPGADLVICDEGHQIKNKKSAISGAVSQIKTRRRIVLTGTPIQNNLKEYYCMVNFIKPSFLGSDREFNNLYANPIKNGQHKDSDSRAIKIMKQRSYVLHNKLSKFVQRREAGVLKEFLPEKFEYVLFVPLTPVQEKMYEVFLQMNEYTTASGETVTENARGKKFKLLADYTSLRKIWTHPKVLEKAWETAVQEKNKREARFRLTASPDSDDDRPDDYNDISSGALSVTNDWWRKHLAANDLESLYPSNKLRVMFEILKQSHERGEKCLIFSAFVAVLNVVEHFMAKIHNQENEQMSDIYGYSSFRGPWEPGKDYYRLDGKTQKNIRHKMITSFNDPSNKRTKCFLISAKAGGQGINLIGANRVIILDTSWNPSNDQQNIFRIFRLGQKRKCYVYRLLAMGTMEEKVYSRSVTKQAMSFRVVDEQQIDRHYSFSELAELYNLSKVADQVRETPILPADDLLAFLLRNYPDGVFKYHEHDSLLENKPEQDLSEDEKKEAWAAYEREIQNNDKPSYLGNLGMLPNFLGPGGFPGAPGSNIGPYPAMNYPGLPGALADMYRNDFGYNSSMNRLMYPYGNQPFPMMNDPSYSSIMGKQPYPNFNLPGSSGSMPDFALQAAINGQSTPGSSSYNSTVALQSLLDLYAKSMSSGMNPSSTVTTATAASVSPSTTTTSAGVSPYSALGALKQFNGFPPMLPGSGAPLPHSSPQLPPPASSQSPSTSGNAALINMLNEQPMPMSSAASSGPFSHLNSPLPAPTIPRSAATITTPSTMVTASPVLTTSTAAKSVIAPTTSSPLNIPQPPVRSSAITRAADPKSTDPKPVPLTTTIVASDDDDVDDDGIPRPHIIVRDPSSINAAPGKPQDKEKVVKKINMGIVYPEEKKKNANKDIMLSAKSITTLAKPTIAVKNMDSMKATSMLASASSSPFAAARSKTSSPVQIASRASSASTSGRPIRASPVQSPLSILPKPPPARPQHSSSLIRSTPLTSSAPALIQKAAPSPTAPRQQQVPVITSAKSQQMAAAGVATTSQNAPISSFGMQQKISTLSSTSLSSTASTASVPTSPLPRGSIAAQQLRELQQRINLSSSSSSASGSNPSIGNTASNHLVVAKPKKTTAAQLMASGQRHSPVTSKQSVHPVGIYSSPPASLLAANQSKQLKPPSAPNAGPGQAGNVAGRIGKNMSPLSDSVSITKITSTGQRIAMNSPAVNTMAPNTSLATTSSQQAATILGRKQDLVITKTTAGATPARKMVPGANMVVKPQDITVAPSLKRNFPTAIKSTNASPSGMIPTMATVSAAGMRPGPAVPGNSITVRKRKATEPPTLIDSLKAKNNSITISEVRSIYHPPAPKKPNTGPIIQPQKRLGSGITITPRKPAPQQQPQNVLEVVEIE